MAKITVSEKSEYVERWYNKSEALKVARDFSKRTGHNVRVAYGVATSNTWSVIDETYKKRGLSDKIVGVLLVDGKPYSYKVFSNPTLGLVYPLKYYEHKLKRVL